MFGLSSSCSYAVLALSSLAGSGENEEAWRLDTDMSILDNKGRALLFLRRYEEALQAFNRCVSANPANARFHMDRGRALASLDRLEQGIEAFDHATALDRNNAEAWKSKGSAQLKLGDNNRAVQSFNRAIDLGVEDGTVLRMKGRALENMGRYEEAREAYSRATVVSPSDQVSGSVWRSSMNHKAYWTTPSPPSTGRPPCTPA